MALCSEGHDAGRCFLEYFSMKLEALCWGCLAEPRAQHAAGNTRSSAVFLPIDTLEAGSNEIPILQKCVMYLSDFYESDC